MNSPVVIITGASSGIGEALAKRFAAAGYRLVLAARSYEQLVSIAEKLPVQSHCVKTDVSKREDCEFCIAEAVRVFGRIDILINNAGISMRASFEELELNVLEKVMQVNFWGTVYCTKAAISHLIQSKGMIIGISSIAGYRGLPGRTGYSASKFAMNGFLESLRTEMLTKGVSVLVVAPGFTTSNIRKVALVADGSAQGESPREEASMMSAEECAEEVFRAVKARKRDLILTLTGKLTVWMNFLFPGWMDKKVLDHFAKEK